MNFFKFYQSIIGRRIGVKFHVFDVESYKDVSFAMSKATQKCFEIFIEFQVNMLKNCITPNFTKFRNG